MQTQRPLPDEELPKHRSRFGWVSPPLCEPPQSNLDSYRKCCMDPLPFLPDDTCLPIAQDNPSEVEMNQRGEKLSPKRQDSNSGARTHMRSESSASLLRELVAHLRQNRSQLRQEWARRIREAQLLT